MNKTLITLMLDSVINYTLGILCILYPFVAELIGVPIVENSFYPNLLGAILIGIGIALTIECYRKQGGMIGLGLGGAVAINLSGGFVLVLWLIFGDLNIPFKGYLFLWSLAIILVFISLIEIFIHLKQVT
ncbi:MAG: hypothetical protein AB1Z31_01650 [Desulfobacterales bacterium]